MGSGTGAPLPPVIGSAFQARGYLQCDAKRIRKCSRFSRFREQGMAWLAPALLLTDGRGR